MEICKNIAVADIPDLEYEGYYWISEDRKPKIVTGKIDKSIFKRLPFVIEANFCSGNISIQVKNIDGNYYVNQIDLSQLNDANSSKITYLGHDLDGRNINIVEYWKEEESIYLNHMKTLVPAWSAFAGFSK